MRNQLWYHRRLSNYFEEHYAIYNFEVKWYTNPSINQWRFKIPELNAMITLTCNDDESISEVEEPINKIKFSKRD